MPADEYAVVPGGGALKLKGGKVKKAKKKKKEKSELEKSLATGEPSSRDEHDGDKQVARDSQPQREHQRQDSEEQDEERNSSRHMTEAERRFEEANFKKLAQLAESKTGRPELLKTHKQRVEELNTYLSKLSEHHDMPKIGPG